MSNTKKGIYPGWWIVATCLMLMALVFAPSINLVGLFVKPMAEHYGVTRTAITLQMTIATLATMAASLFAGKIFVKFDIRKVMIVSTIVKALTFAGYSISPNVTVIYIFAIIGGIASAFITSIPISILINNWFGPKMRGRAMGIAMMGSGLGSMILNPIIGYMNSQFGWKISYYFITGLILVIALPMVFFTIALTPEEKGHIRIGEETVHEDVKVIGFSLAESMKTNIFWIMGIAFIIYSMVSTIFNANGAPYYNDIGFDDVQAASLIAASSAALIVGKLVLGWLCDRKGAFTGAIIASITMFAGVTLLLITAKSPSFAIPSAMIFGLGNALPTVTLPLLVAEIFGNKEYGSIVGIMNVASAFGGAMGPILGSVFFDATGSYITAWYIVLGFMALMTVLTLIGKKITSSLHASLA